MADFNDVLDTLKYGAIKAKSGAEKLARDISVKGEGMAQRAKLEYGIRNIKSKIEAAYADLGEYVYDEFAGEEIEGPIHEKCHRITDLYRELKALTDELCESRNVQMCANCGGFCEKDKKFCSECGAPLK